MAGIHITTDHFMTIYIINIAASYQPVSLVRRNTYLQGKLITYVHYESDETHLHGNNY